MLLFRLAWVTSWLSLLLTSSQSLLRSSDYRLATESEKDFIPLDSLGEMPELLAPTFPLTTQLNSLDSVTFQPSLTLSGPQPVRQRTGRSPHSKGQWVAWQNSLENRSCPSTVKSQEVVPEILSTFSVDVPQEHSADLSLPQRIGKIIKGLFDWSGLLSPKAATEPSGHLVTVTASVDRRVLQAKFIKQGVSGENRSSKQKGKVENLADEMPFQVWVNGKAIAQLSQQHQAEAIAQSFKNALSKPDFEPLNLKPALLNEKPAILMGDRLLLVVEQSLVAEQTANRELLAINWTNNLRSALGVVPLDLAQAQEKMYGLVETRSQFEGLASWYGGYFHGRMHQCSKNISQSQDG